jgi:nitroimidazol reductase NimA-like FMN-containing flavoprotein (pyridoxamine 5'-phosphate oxidase superfamily)
MNNPTNRTDVRRADRAVHDEPWLKEMMHTAATGVLATVADGQPFLNANLFVYDESRRAVYLHTARRGTTRDTIESHDRVAFTVMELGRMLPADTALEFSCEYASVVLFGRGSVVADPEEARDALQLLLDKYFADLAPGSDYRATTDDELKRTSVFRVDIEEWVGKRKHVDPQFPGARRYSSPSMVDTAPAEDATT